MTDDNFILSKSEKINLLYSARHLGNLESVIKEAYKDKKSYLWGELQRTLFYLNNKIMKKGFGINRDDSNIEWQFRSLAEKIEISLMPKFEIPEEVSDPSEFIHWLKDRIHAHRVNKHELFEYFDHDDISHEDMRHFLSNYRVNMQKFHLHVAAYSLIVPFEMREELYDNLYDEFGRGDFKEAHPNLFEPLMEYFGGAKENDWNPETFHLLNTKINLCWFANELFYGMGGMGALELSIPAQQIRVLAHLRRKGLSEKLVKFFVVHCELDDSHGNGWFAAGLPYLKTRKQFNQVYNGAMRMLEARAGVYDGILSQILSNKQRTPEPQPYREIDGHEEVLA